MEQARQRKKLQERRRQRQRKRESRARQRQQRAEAKADGGGVPGGDSKADAKQYAYESAATLEPRCWVGYTSG